MSQPTPATPKFPPPKFPLVENMKNRGGSFVAALAGAMIAADPENYRKLCATFPDIVDRYSV